VARVSGRRWVSLIGAAICVSALSLASACSSDSPGVKPIKAADAYTAAINWYVDSLPTPPPTTNGDAPGPAIVYVFSESGQAIPSDVQASVARNMAERKDEVTVFFIDVRDDALDVDLENQPVKDDGVLLLVGDVAEGPPPVNVLLNVYRDGTDNQPYEMKVFRSGSDVIATGETVAPQG
jgi:hypothetical protein